MTFSPDQWLIIALAFLLGLVLGMALLASPKWKLRCREEAAKRQELETEVARLRREAGEMNALRHAAARDETRYRTDAERVRAAEARAETSPPADAEALRAAAAREQAAHPGEAESLREAAARDEARRRDEGRGPL
jgi:peptidoglycan hydrolase CwlO-like protein